MPKMRNSLRSGGQRLALRALRWTAISVAAALGVPLVAIFVASAPELTRPLGRGPIAILGRKGGEVSLAEVEASVARVIEP